MIWIIAKTMAEQSSTLHLRDGTSIVGKAFGAARSVAGEVGELLK